ncbi:MAG TPA: hypothetical protein VMB21_05560 [Candidatus Limnocylindria bacterium]|nr:hypothetical protein [Candidatus Limnocylindria bacterium]
MKLRFQSLLLGCLGLMWLLNGCVHQIDWPSRIGTYTYDDSVRELGPPDKKETLSDGTLVAEWLVSRGENDAYYRPAYPLRRHELVWTVEANTMSSPDSFVRLTFSPDRKLTQFKRFYR